jgi:glucuronoarabinoxylan endo-1,4-beta-xylanase
MKRVAVLLPFLFTFLLSSNCGSDSVGSDENGENGDREKEVTFTIDRNVTHQTIDGFGFFGARDVWWAGNHDNLFSEEWAQMIIEDLGLTIWRNEYYPPETPNSPQDADWDKQRPAVEGIAAAAENAGVDLKMIYTVWSPPEHMKIRLSSDGSHLPGSAGRTRYVDEPHPGGTKDGGTLNPEMYEEFGHWLADGIALYEELGIDIYAISPQNEPLFEQFYNSCYYRVDWYAEMLERSMPVVRERYPDVKIFGSENMLEMEGLDDRRWFYHYHLMNQNPAALDELDIWSVHGYTDGVAPTESARASAAWRNHFEDYAKPSGKPTWMTETSGFEDRWLSETSQPGALDLGLAIHAALHFGNISAWVWWQGSQLNELGRYNLMQGEANPGKRYHVSKQFFRYIRPGAERVDLHYDDNDGVFATAYQHNEMDTFTIVAINTNSEPVILNLDGNQIPGQFDQYVTTAGQNTNKTEGVAAGEITLPASSIVTLVHGNVYEHLNN